jgi:iron complex transport system ATP-binding protein
VLGARGVAHLADRPYTAVSGRERQLALIARAVAQEPRVMVMDEPTASLDFGNRVRVLGEIGRLARRGLAVVLSTHEPDHALRHADRVAVLHAGRLAALGPPGDVITPAMLRSVYGVEVDILTVAGRDGARARVCLPAPVVPAGPASGASRGGP